MAGEGLVNMTPSGVTFTGLSASINSTGGVECASVSFLAIDGVFVSAYENYMMTWRGRNITNAGFFTHRMRASGVSASASNYSYQYLNLNNTTQDAQRSTAQTSVIGSYLSNERGNTQGAIYYIYGPQIVGATTLRTTSMDVSGSVRYLDVVGIHGASAAYDGFSIENGGEFFTGTFHFFGYEV